MINYLKVKALLLRVDGLLCNCYAEVGGGWWGLMGVGSGWWGLMGVGSGWWEMMGVVVGGG